MHKIAVKSTSTYPLSVKSHMCTAKGHVPFPPESGHLSARESARSGAREECLSLFLGTNRTRACRFGPRKRTFNLDRAAAIATSRRGEPTTHPVRTNDLRYALQ